MSLLLYFFNIHNPISTALTLSALSFCSKESEIWDRVARKDSIDLTTARTDKDLYILQDACYHGNFSFAIDRCRYQENFLLVWVFHITIRQSLVSHIICLYHIIYCALYKKLCFSRNIFCVTIYTRYLIIIAFVCGQNRLNWVKKTLSVIIEFLQ